MRDYICYVHTPSSMTPHMRVLSADDTEDLIERMKSLLEEWPSFDLVDIYDRRDNLVARLASGGKPHLC